ncbi:interleukin-17F-like isoform X1 [Gasterosteus aculeatus]
MSRLVGLQMVNVPVSRRERALKSRRAENLHACFIFSPQIPLLLFNGFVPASSSAAAATRSRGCISLERLNRTVDRFQRTHGSPTMTRNRQDARQDARQTCAQAAAGMSGELRDRSLAPWRYSINTEDDRIPHKIAVAECLCDGCIINQREDMRYNSVPVFAPLMVMRKTPCPRDHARFMVSRDWIKVPVGCTCAAPKYAKRST